MAKKNEAYTPSAELMALVRRYFSGDTSVEHTLNEAMLRDPQFLAYFKKYQAQMKAQSGRGNTWSVGTLGSRVSGSNNDRELGGVNKGVSQWNQQRNMRAGYNGTPSSPGGFKSSGRDEDSALRRSGSMSGKAVLQNIRFDRNDNLIIGNRKYNKAQRDAILRRGLSGATMNWSDQAVYDAIIASQEETARRKEEAEAQRISDIEDAKRADRQRISDKRASDADLLKRRRDLYDWRFKQDYEAKLASEKDAREAQDKAEKEEAERLTFNRTYGIPEDVVLTAEDMKAIRDGKAYYGLSKKDKQTKKELEEEMDRIIADPSTPLSSLENLYAQEEAIKQRFHSRVRDKDEDELTPEESFKKRRTSVELSDGRVIEGWLDEKNNFTPFPEAKEKEETWNGMTFKDFVGAVPKVMEKANPDISGQTIKVEVPTEDRLKEAVRLWGMRDTLGNPTEATVVDPANPSVILPNGLYEQDVNPSEQYSRQPAANVATPTQNGISADDFFGVEKPSPFTEEAADMAQLVTEKCPVCNEPLNGFGVCDVCGWPDEPLVNEWNQINETEAR